MRYQISGKQIDIGDALQTHVQTELDDGARRNMPAARPMPWSSFPRRAHEFVCEAIVHLSTGLTARPRRARDRDLCRLRQLREKMDKQLRRYKRRLKDHHKDRVEPVELLDRGLLYPRADGGRR